MMDERMTAMEKKIELLQCIWDKVKEDTVVKPGLAMMWKKRLTKYMSKINDIFRIQDTKLQRL